jgi:hypothetical protein
MRGKSLGTHCPVPDYAALHPGHILDVWLVQTFQPRRRAAQISSATIVMAPHGHSWAQMPQPLQ